MSLAAFGDPWKPFMAKTQKPSRKLDEKDDVKVLFKGLP